MHQYFFSAAALFKCHQHNIYVLLEFGLLTWQFYNWGFFTRRFALWPILISVIAGIWIWENFFPYRLNRFSSWYRVFYSFALVLMGISTLNRQIAKEKRHLLSNPIILICFTIIIYYTYKVLVEPFWLYGLNEGKDIQEQCVPYLSIH